jgi:hypothetical protein
MTTDQPSDLMTGFILSLLTPFLMTGSITDPNLARKAAAETVAAYQATGPRQLVTVAQIIAFGLTAVDTLRLSLQGDLPLPMKDRLRRSASTMTRIAREAATTLETHLAEPPEEDPDPAEILAKIPPAPPPQPAQQHPATDRQIDLSWAQAMTDVATEFTAELPGLPSAQKRTHLARIGALSAIASTLRLGKAPSLKTRLLGSTNLMNLTAMP